MPSKPHGVREEFLEVVGVSFYRCHKCHARYSRIGTHLGEQSMKDRTSTLVVFALSSGLLICTALALYIQKMAHRWPF